MVSEKTFRKVLVPVDGSISSLLAQEFASKIAKKFDAKVTVIHVMHHVFSHLVEQPYRTEDRHEHVPMGPSGGNFPPSIHVPETPETAQVTEKIASELTSWAHDKGENTIAEAISLFREDGITAESKLIEHGDPANSILKEEEEGKYDLVTIGSSEEEEERPHLGSVAVKVLRHSLVPVLIARNKSMISKILAAVDGSEISERVLEKAVVLASATGGQLTVLYVQEPSLFAMKPEIAKDFAERVLSEAARKAKDIKMDRRTETGDAAKMIIQVADKGDYDLIVMGGRGLSSARRFLLGSVSDHVAHYANRSVLFIK